MPAAGRRGDQRRRRRRGRRDRARRDFRASPVGIFAFLFTRVGLAGADMGAAYLLPRIVGPRPRHRAALLGDKIAARAADRIGLASEVVDDDDLRRRDAGARPRAWPTGPRSPTRRPGPCSRASSTWPSAGAIELEAPTQALLMRSRGPREFYAAWSEGRTPAGRADEQRDVPPRSSPRRSASPTRSSARRRATVYLAGQIAQAADGAMTATRSPSSSTSPRATSSRRCGPRVVAPGPRLDAGFVTAVAEYKASLRDSAKCGASASAAVTRRSPCWA